MKKLTLAILLFALLLSVFAACNNSKTPADSDTDAETEAPGNGYGDDLPADLKFDGKEFVIATYEGGNIGQGWACFFDCDEPEAGNILEEASYNRNVEVESRLDATITCEELWPWDGTSNGLVFAYTACGLAGKDTYQMFFMESFVGYEAFIIDELLTDVASLPYMDLNKEYYNKKANDVYYLRDALYLFVSDITYACQNSNQVLINNDMLVDLGYEETYVYDKVNNGTWTIDTVFDMIEGVADDLNSDGTIDFNDRVGFTGQPYGPCGFFPAAGLRGTYLTDEGFAFDYGTDYAIEVVDRILDLVEHPDTWFAPNSDWTESFTAFWNGNALFMGYASEIRALNQLNFEFGLLPYPKYSESQETYSTSTSGGIAIIPVTISDEDFVGAVVEAMASGSHRYFVPAFYENFIEAGVIRDDYSRANWAKMLNEWGSYEFTRGIAPDQRLGGYGIAYGVIGSASRDYISTWDSQKEMLAELCQEFYDWYLAD
ncbi:MAG: hypothetical protein IJD10_00880 [Clostridia bacterium]|nr:hypothetical protein [Clostridia bacterium]